MKIAIIIPYFGQWPSYFNVYLQGCSANPWLDVMFFTDCMIPEQHPPNVHFQASSLNAISKLASEKLGINLNLSSSYKLCDLKPFYGKVFEDFLTNYDYWGYGDIDVLYGNLKPFVLPRLLKGVDILSNRKELLSGSLTILRNNSVVNNLYKNIPNYDVLLQSIKNECLDETAHSNITWSGGSKLDLPQSSFTFTVSNADSTGMLKASFVTTCKEHILEGEKIVYENKRLTFGNTELGYYHYVCNKNDYKYKLPKWKKIPEKFYILSTGFYTPNEFDFFIMINKYREMKGFTKRIIVKALKFFQKNGKDFIKPCLLRCICLAFFVLLF